MNKKIYIFILFLSSVFLLQDCVSSKKYLKQGNYDMAVKYAVKKLQRNKNNDKNLEVLKQAYPLAEMKDSISIASLHEAGQADRWEQVTQIYENMNYRQSIVEALYPLFYNGVPLKFHHIDYSKLIDMASIKAADYFYNHAKALMSNKTKFSYREAFNEFQKAAGYSNSFTDLSELMDSCYKLGQSYVILIIVNSSPTKVPAGFLANLIDQNSNNLNSFWIQYYTTDKRNGDYDIAVNVTLTNIAVSPNNISLTEHTESKKIKDGWEYKLDDKGNKVLDSAGNAIKIPKYKTITCKVQEHRQFKQAHIDGAINYVETKSGKIVLSVPIATDHNFEHSYYSYKGNPNALSNKTKARLREKPVRYPSDIDMLNGANATLKNTIYQALMDHRSFVESNY